MRQDKLSLIGVVTTIVWISFITFALVHANGIDNKKKYYDSLYNPKDTNSFFYHSKIKTKMKQVKIVCPKSAAKDIAKSLAENGIVTNLSWVQDGSGFFSTELHVYITFPEDKSDRVIALFGKYIKDEK